MSTKSPALRVPNASSPFRTDKAGSRNLTSEQIADHLAAFKRAGGTVEVLGVTRTLKEIGNKDPAEAATAAPEPKAPRTRKK
jgi:hypothetical protein